MTGGLLRTTPRGIVFGCGEQMDRSSGWKQRSRSRRRGSLTRMSRCGRQHEMAEYPAWGLGLGGEEGDASAYGQVGRGQGRTGSGCPLGCLRPPV